MRQVQVVGGGSAGAMAALAAMRGGASVRIFEKSRFPRHKVCGEFLSPAILKLMRRAGCEEAFLQLRPAELHEMRIHFGRSARRPAVRHRLSQPAYGLSRYELDRLLLQHAASLGAQVTREHWTASTAMDARASVIVSTGRKSIAPAGNRLFGFKAHFHGGPVNDVVELYFFDDCYIGVSAIEGGTTNVCGLAPERMLRSLAFDPTEVLQRCEPLAERVRGLTQKIDWLTTGPLVFSQRLDQPIASSTCYQAGDALGFIDPFTGSGMLNAMLTGELAGLAASRGESAESYLRDCHRLLRRPFAISSAFRIALGTGLAGLFAPFVPGRLLFEMTRPALSV